MTTLNHAPDSIAKPWSITYTDGAGNQTEDRFATEDEARQRVAYLADRGRDSALRGPGNVEWITKAGPTPIASAKSARPADEDAPPTTRPVFTREGRGEEWHDGCPSWCTKDGVGHEVDVTARTHLSAPLRVRSDAWARFFDRDDEGATVISSARVDVRLRRTARGAVPLVELRHVYGSANELGRKVEARSPIRLYPDEARELITVLEHLLKVVD